VNFVLAAATVLFSLSDPKGDAHGDGGYTLPERIDEATLDLRTFTAVNQNGQLELRLTMDRVANPENAPNGFSGPAFEVFLAQSRGGVSALGPSGFFAPSGRGWQYRVSLNGFQARLEAAPSLEADAPIVPPTVRVEGSDVVIDTSLPARQYAFWAFVGVYDPLSRDGLRIPVTRWSAGQLASPIEDAPPVVDVLSSEPQVGLYASRTVDAVNEPVSRTDPLLLTGLLGLCIALATTLWGIVRRR
jgi:hypothetical protein